MKLYHGSNTAGIKTLQPHQADHDRPYIYLTTIDVVSAFYICNAVERPYYWFPYGFNKNNVPVYHELYPDALKEVSENVKGCLYEVDPAEEQVIPFKDIPCARLGIAPIEVTACTEIDNAYDYFIKCVAERKLIISKFESKTKKQLDSWYSMILNYLIKKDMIQTPDCSYAVFVREKFPHVWQKYLTVFS